MPVTFGSIGDIIAVGILVKDLVAALNQSRGSQAEYKQLVDELDLLGDVLARIDHLCNIAGTTTGRRFEVSALHDATLQIAQNCRKCIEGFSVRLKRYGKTLGSSGVRTKSEAFKAVAANIRWQLGEKEEVVRFRAEIASQTASLNLVLVATTWGVGKDNQAMLEGFKDATRDQLQMQHGTLSKLSDNVTETNALVSQTSAIASQTNVMVSKVSGPIINGLVQIGDICAHVKTTLSRIFSINVATYKMVLELKTSLPGYLERSLLNEPFILEDAIGRISPVHLQFISSWEALDSVLETRFRGLQGHKKVQSGHWVLQDHATGREISRRRNWEGTFLPGQRVNMSLLIQRETTVDAFDSSAQTKTSNQAACPRCQADAPDSSGAEIQCDTCGLCFRRIVEIEEVDPKPTPATPKPWLDKPTFGMVSFKPGTFGPQPAKFKRRRESDDFDISGFKRIHIVSKENRVKLHVFDPVPRTAHGPHSSRLEFANINQISLTLDTTGIAVVPGHVMEGGHKAVSDTADCHDADNTDNTAKRNRVNIPNGFEANQAYILSITRSVTREARPNWVPDFDSGVPIATTEEEQLVTPQQWPDYIFEPDFDFGVPIATTEEEQLVTPQQWPDDIFEPAYPWIDQLVPLVPESSPASRLSEGLRMSLSTRQR